MNSTYLKYNVHYIIMINRKLIFSVLLTSITLFLLINPAVAGRPEDRNRSGPRMGDSGMMGGSEYMEVTGEIIVGDGITISLSITPTEELLQQIGDRKGEDMPSIDDMTNSLNVTLYELVEYEDVNVNNGYDSNDTVISAYSLDDSNLGELQSDTIGDISRYELSSNDGVFKMIIEVNITDNLPHDWKWSLLIEYPFVSDSSNLAMVHTVESSRASMIDNQHRYQSRSRPGDNNFNPENNMRYENNSMIAEHSRIPIVFGWDSTAIVDGVDASITATSFGDSFALSLPQGDVIDYDPQISIDTDNFNNFDNEIFSILGNVLGNLINNSYIAILSTIGIVSIIIFLTRKK